MSSHRDNDCPSFGSTGVTMNKISQRYHGYNFEVPSSPTVGLTTPIPLKAMGQFNHEAIAVDPKSGIVYQTEDRHDSLIYRFIPDVPGTCAGRTTTGDGNPRHEKCRHSKLEAVDG